ncbi:Adenylate-forming reductase [Paramyrothecium foliicola]|nr:Adenylate-forming reductase [Paramyrothecium foliicola]
MAVTDISRRSLSTADARLPVHSFGRRGTPRFLTVTEAFYYHAVAHPETLAAQDLSSSKGPVHITYQDLAVRSSRLASKLRQLGVSPGDRVPLVVKRGINMLVSILAVLSCGAQYVPLDGGVVPDTTLRFVIEQTGGQSGVVLALSSTKHRLSEYSAVKVVVVDDPETLDETAEKPIGRYLNLAKPGNGCYIIYTSGTTGTPKGVDVTHNNVTNLVCQSPGDLGITTGMKVGQTLNISFDMAAWEVLGCLCNGGTLVLRGSDWKAAIREIEVLICTPSILAKYDPLDYPLIKTVATAGEPSSQRLADAWALSKTYYNCCGPTETTIVNTMHRHVSGRPLTIGKPTPNNNVYILNEDGEPIPEGEAGVMWAGGLGVSNGYVKLPEKTAEKYKLDEFAGSTSAMYNTGDLGRWLADGSIEILGRCDDQIKLKGFRIELDGVTASLNACPVVDRAVVILADGELQAFVTPVHCDIAVAKKHMERCQPYYAVPTKFHVLDALPLTLNGKIDKKTLKASLHRASEDSRTGSDTTADSIIKPGDVVLTEKKLDTVPISPSSSSLAASDELKVDLEAAVPDKLQGKRQRGVRHRVLIVYRRLFTFIGLINIAGAIAIILTGFPREWLGIATAMNLTLAVLMRQAFVINALYTVTCNVPKSWPLWIRVRAARIFHFGGVHSAAGVSAALWLLANNIGDAVCMTSGNCSGHWGQLSLASKIVSWVLTAGFVAMLVMAYPTIRKQYHDFFERTHRFVGWSMLAVFWAQVVLTTNDIRGDVPLGLACVRTPPFWLLIVATLSIASSWFWLRKVPVDSEVLSNHAIRLHFNYTVPVNGSFTRISYKPLTEWHSFATVPAPRAENGRDAGYSLVVSNAGDWTKKTIQEPPTHLWVRDVPTCGVMRIATLFNRIVLVGTGSGIGPLLGHIQNQSCPTQLIWSTPRPEATFGTGLCNAIKKHVPDAIIHDTKIHGRPDLVKMAFNLYKSFGAEAVIIIANEKITKKVVYGLETRGVPAYGAIWDS